MDARDRPAEALLTLARGDEDGPEFTPRRARASTGELGSHEAVRDLTVSLRVVHGLLRVIVKAGAPEAELLRAAQVDLSHVHGDDARIPRGVADRLIELALELTRNPALGLHCAERVSQYTFVPISHLIAHSSTLCDALDAMVHFHRLLSDEIGCQITELNGKVVIQRLPRIGESLRLERFGSEMMMAGLFRLVRTFAGPRPVQTSFAYAAPSYRAEYARIFIDTDRFDQPLTGLVFDRALLSAPSPDRDPEIHAALHALAEQRLMRIMQQTPYAVRVRELLIRQDGWRTRADMATVARSLGLSVRSLRRRLAREQMSYTTVANEALAIVAKRFLRQQRTIQETAHEMGFADTSSFHRAFKQWTGTTPRAYREAQLEREARS